VRVLFSTGHPAHTALPPVLGDEQVNCGPGLVDVCAPDGRVRSLAAPPGAYDLAALAAKLPSEQRPDVVVCRVEAGDRDLPRNLGAFGCPTVVIVAGTHTGIAPLTAMMGYLAAESFDRVVLSDNRHHAPFFHAAGVRNLHWFPGLLFPHSDAAVHAARRQPRERRLAVTCEVGDEPRRQARLLRALAVRALPVVCRKAFCPVGPLEFFGASLLGFNASDNGELNLRIFEILAAGALLLTDRLAPESGFEQMFLEGREVVAYGSATELANVAGEFLARPDEARALGEAGARWFDENLGERRRRELFRLLAGDGISVPEFALPAPETVRVFFGGDTDRLARGIAVYEDVQELHRTQETVKVGISRGVPEEIVAIYSTLPRAELRRLDAAAAPDFAIYGVAHRDAPGVAKAVRRWCHDEATDHFAAGSRPADEGPAVAVALAAARLREGTGQPAEAEALLREAARAHGQTGAAARALGDFLKRQGRLIEALQWHGRPLGCAAPAPARPADRRRRVLFLVQHGARWHGLASVYAAFDADPEWESIVIGLPFDSSECTTEALRNAGGDYLGRHDIPFVRGDEFPLDAGCAEVAFLSDPDDGSRPVGWRTEDLVRLGVRIAHCPSGFATTDGEEDHARHFDSPLQRLSWAVFAWSDAHKAMFRRYCAVGDAHVTVTGHPRTDAMRKLDAARDPALERFIAGRRAVCWSPHFDIRPDGATPFGRGRSTFARWMDFLPEEFARRREFAFIIRPHPRLFAQLELAGVCTAARLDEFVGRCTSAGNIHLDHRPSCLPALAASSALLADNSSLLPEFAFTGRPLLHLRNPHGPPLERHTFAEGFCAEAETETGVVRFLDLVAAGEDVAQVAQRRAIFRRCLHLPVEGAGVAIKREVERRLLEEEHGVVLARGVIAA
jgi:hypothetical protein